MNLNEATVWPVNAFKPGNKIGQTHAMSGDSTYKAWVHMRHPSGGDHPVSVAWGIFENFLRDMGERPSKTFLARIDKSKPYEAGNCKWMTHAERRTLESNLMVTYDEVTLPLSELVRSMGLDYQIVRNRFFVLGWRLEDALHTPVKRYKQR